MTNREQTIKEWVWSAPPEILSALASVPLMNSLREHRNRMFQMQGAYDGAMSEDCKNLFKSDYRAMAEFVSAIEDR